MDVNGPGQDNKRFAQIKDHTEYRALRLETVSSFGIPDAVLPLWING